MADWGKPTNTSNYQNVLAELKARDEDCAKMDFSTSTNIPDGTIRWNSANNRFEKWNATASTWEVLSAKYLINVDKVDGYDVGNASGNVPLNNGTVNANLNADMVDGLHGVDLVKDPLGRGLKFGENLFYFNLTPLGERIESPAGRCAIYPNISPGLTVRFSWGELLGNYVRGKKLHLFYAYLLTSSVFLHIYINFRDTTSTVKTWFNPNSSVYNGNPNAIVQDGGGSNPVTFIEVNIKNTNSSPVSLEFCRVHLYFGIY